MPIYKAPVEDTLFVLDEVLQLARYNNLPGFSEAPVEALGLAPPEPDLESFALPEQADSRSAHVANAANKDFLRNIESDLLFLTCMFIIRTIRSREHKEK